MDTLYYKPQTVAASSANLLLKAKKYSSALMYWLFSDYDIPQTT